MQKHEGSKSESTLQAKPPFSKWAKWSLRCVVLSFGLFAMAVFSSLTTLYLLGFIFFIGSSLSLLFAFLTGLEALVKIETSKGVMRGELLAYIGLLIGGFLYYMGEYGPYLGTGEPPYTSRAHRIICGVNLKGLGTALTLYADNYGAFPENEWSDRLIEYMDVSPKSFTCPASDDMEGECSYALNKYVAGQKNEFSGDIVLAFETTLGIKSQEEKRPIRERESFSKYPLLSEMFQGDEKVYPHRWNQMGGPKDLIAVTHSHKGTSQGCNILFADGHNEWCRVEDLPKLQWHPTDVSIRWNQSMMPDLITEKKTFTLSADRNLMILGGILTALSIIGWLLLPGMRMKSFGLLMAITAALMGAYWAWETEKFYMYYGNRQVVQIGLKTGIFWGVFTGIWFSFVICRFYKSSRIIPWVQGKRRIQYDLLLGMAAGLFCSTAVHITLALHHEMHFWGALSPGIYFGLLAGVITGFIARVIFVLLFSKKTESHPIPVHIKEVIPDGPVQKI